ncbi:phosphoserine phosphatase [Lysobacter enzymogenes]|uniref:Phosphoserine phosphatase n=1 Tax=Lysobacter enzymogenes TaxID=69 RepID=A0AAU9AAG4_LYSEN|nr:phosphoserine phosphatase [Lysobacter enzymogenes]
MSLGWNILCDFDGTIALQDVTDAVLVRYARPGWELIEAAWKAGRITSRECMGQQVALLDAGRDELDALLDGIRIDPAFPEFVRAAHAAGCRLTVVSDGLDYAIERILARHGLGPLPVIANRLVADGERGWRLDFPHSRQDCRVGSGTCKCAVAAAAPPRLRNLLIGDGQSDFCVAGRADYVFAKAKLIEHCRQQRIAHAPIGGFLEALALLPSLLDGLLDTPRETVSVLPLPSRASTP